MRLAEAIREARHRLGWSQARLARALEATEQSVRNWERGQDPTFAYYEAMCRLFDWPLPYDPGSPIPGYLNSPTDVAAA